jgi:hypothetical protein
MRKQSYGELPPLTGVRTSKENFSSLDSRTLQLYLHPSSM